MKPGSVVVLRMPQSGRAPGKIRPAVVLAELPGRHRDLFVCGMSTRFADLIPDWDEVVQPDDPDFAASGLRQASVIRLNFLAAAGSSSVAGRIGKIDAARLKRLRARLAEHLSG